MRLIDADELVEKWRRECQICLDNYTYFIDSSTESVFDDFIRDVETAETVEPTLYGYPIEHLAFVARVMEKEGVTPETVANIIKDTGKIVKLIIDEAVDISFKGIEI